MIRTLDDAWKWYKAVDRLVRNMRRMARADVERLLREMVHPAMVSAAKDLEESVASGSFRKVTAAC